MYISLHDSYAQTFSKEIIWNFVLFPVARKVNLTIIKDGLINWVSKSCFIKSIKIGKQKNLFIRLSVYIHRRFYLYRSFSECTGFIGANDIHAAEIFYRSKSLDNHFLLSHFFCTMCKVYTDNCG